MTSDARARNILIKLLGAFWILDGLLQFQPKMFAPDFVSDVLAPNLANQPSVLRDVVAWGISVWNINPVVANIVAALIQIIIGTLLWFFVSSANKKFQFGLYLSIVWGFVVWIFGEGLGMLFTGSASFYTGAPGSALVYVLLAFLLLIPSVEIKWYPKIAGWILIVCSLLQLQPFPLFLVTLIIGLALAFKPNRIVGIFALIFLFVVWWLGQDFGGLSTLFVGTATDPNTAPVLALFLMPLFVVNSPLWKKTKR